MGCKSGKPDTFSIETEYRNKNLPMPDATDFENDFEKEAFYTINVLRANPKALIHHLKELRSKFFVNRNFLLKVFAFISSELSV